MFNGGFDYAATLGAGGRRKDHVEEQVHNALLRSEGVPHNHAGDPVPKFAPSMCGCCVA